jgi:hypothetical protein
LFLCVSRLPLLRSDWHYWHDQGHTF